MTAASAACGIEGVSAIGAESGHPLELDRSVTALTPTLTPAAQAPTGHMATVTLDLTNRQKSTVDLGVASGYCPNIAGSAGTNQHIEYQLNCVGATQGIPPGDTQPFLIQFTVPATTPSGPLGVSVWISESGLRRQSRSLSRPAHEDRSGPDRLGVSQTTP